ncbi:MULTISPECIES: hypothetical protein [unclassified Streptomyces]|uniref:hypothetical protein n=1 Tax=unclassified Streptomyces TaxID=2593676 RepID=UPI001CC13FEE|nr:MULTISPECIES: hypothetical protein [unclassified Streptomyces]WPO74510.1 hypothetical protein R9806_29790 [Streptomyces sp. KN37]
MADTQQVDESKPDDGKQAARAERKAARLAKEIGAFAREHGGAEGQIAYLGQKGARIVLVGEDGGWGDLVAPTHAVALSAVEKSGITVHEDFDGDFAAKVRTGPYEWTRMAGIQLGGPKNA